jgi:hypothetical protein
MKRVWLVGTFLSILLQSPSAPFLAHPRATSCAQGASERKEIKVWVNTNSGVYHCPGSRWYGATKEGKYMGECEAQKAGYRPAYGKPCGSDCK